MITDNECTIIVDQGSGFLIGVFDIHQHPASRCASPGLRCNRPKGGDSDCPARRYNML
jgi:hypothetical protein